MAKARTPIKTGKSKARPKDDPRDKSHLERIEVGEDIGAEDAKALPASAIDSGAKKVKRVIDSEDNESYAGLQAARESLMMRPDNPNRPPEVEGETWKVAGGGAFGRDTVSVIAQPPASEGGGPLHAQERTQIGSITPTDEEKELEKARTKAFEDERKATEKAAKEGNS